VVGSFDRLREPSDPNPPEGRGQPAGDGSSDLPEGAGRPDRPRSGPETEAEAAKRLGLGTLNRGDCYDLQRAAADAQEAAIRRRDAEAEAGKTGEAAESPPDKPPTPVDQPERQLERPRDYWTEVPRFFAMWHRHAERWPWQQRSEARDATADMRPEQRTATLDAVQKVPEREPPISENVKRIEAENVRGGWLAGYEFRRKGQGRLVEKVAEALETSAPDASPDEIAEQIPDAIRYTFCLESESYTDGYWDIRSRFEACGYEMYHSKNSWADPEYKGVNTRWITPEGQRFEVQFHTPESFHAKHEVTHRAYERLRNPSTSETERRDLSSFQREVSSWIPLPTRVTEILSYKKKGF
jgi:hypothetical protein